MLMRRDVFNRLALGLLAQEGAKRATEIARGVEDRFFKETGRNKHITISGTFHKMELLEAEGSVGSEIREKNARYFFITKDGAMARIQLAAGETSTSSNPGSLAPAPAKG